MKCKPYQIILSAVYLFFSYQNPYAFQKQADGVLFDIKKQKETDARWVKIQVCDENIIRVLASPGESFSTCPILMVDITKWEKVPFSVNDEGDCVELVTSKVKVRVDPITGAVAFYNTNGQLLLQERAGGGKIITSAEVMRE